MKTSERVYRLGLRLYPAEFRERFAEEMACAFRDGERAAGGGLRRAGFWMRCAGDLVKEAWRERRAERRSYKGREGGMEAWWMDLTYAWRGLRRRPALVTVAVLTLALGVGATTAIFGVVHAVLLRPFDLPDADRLVVIQDQSIEGGAPYRTTGGAWLDWQEGNRSFSGLGLISGWTMNLTEPGLEAERVNGARVSASYFDVLGVEPALGRTFTPEENRGEHRVVVLSDALWRGRYGGDPAIAGASIRGNQGESWEVVGVMPPIGLPVPGESLDLLPTGRERAVWVPADLDQEWISGYRSHVFLVIGRLGDGVTPAAAAADIEAITEGIRERHPDFYTGTRSHMATLFDVVVGDARRDLWILLGAVALVLVVACANLTNLLLARALDRGREWAVRAAMGAGGGRLVRQGILESLLLGLAGGLGGMVVAALGLSGLEALLPADLPRQAELGLGLPVLLFAVGAAVAAGLLTGLLPALRGGRPALARELRAGGRGSVGGGSRTARGLVVAQLGLACTLLVGAGLLVRSVRALDGVELGARTDRTLSIEFLLSRGGGREEVSDFIRTLEERTEELPAVEAASVAYDHPLEANWTETFTVTDRPPPEPGQRPGATYRPVSPGYFEMMGIPVRSGRPLGPSDGVDGPAVAVVNQAFVDRHFAGEDALGRRMRVGVATHWGDDAPEEFEIVGVVANVRFRGLRQDPPAAFYLSARQSPTSFFRLLIRTRGEPRDVLPAVRALVAELDPALPLSAVTTLDEAYRRATAADRFNALLLSAFALAALLVAAAGIHGVLAYAVARRTAETGVRLALGARPATVFRGLVAEGVGLALAGLVIGMVGGLLTGRLLSGLLFGVAPHDPVVLAGVGLTLLAVAIVSGTLPARAAARTDPAVALRAE